MPETQNRTAACAPGCHGDASGISFPLMLEGRSSSPGALVVALAFWLLVACDRNVRRNQEPPSVPTVRVYVTSTLAGAMEPCGCRKDMLGGVDHAAALLEQGKREAPHALVVGAGPLFFMEPGVSADNAEKDQQDRWKADAIAGALAHWQLAAWAPGVNDFGRGAGMFAELAQKSGATPLAANLTSEELQLQRTRVVERAGVRIGLTGVSMLGQVPSTGLTESDAVAQLRAAQQELVAQGTTVRVALIAASRGDAMRMIEAVPGFHLAVIGKSKDSGENNDAAVPPALLGETLVVQGPNHLQAMPVIDLYIRDGHNSPQELRFADATGIRQAERRATLQSRIADLSKRLDEWKKSPSVRAEDIAAREADVARMRKELQSLSEVKAPRDGSFFRYELRQVRERLGSDAAVLERMRRYYKQVNEHNRVAFKDRKPQPAPEGTPSFVGIERCTSCHAAATAFWRSTGHAKAYRTLEDDFKEFNLDCVGCHVTGYEMVGGSTVTFVDGLKDVQCESCHGPGSLHAEDRSPGSILLTPPESLCVKCHHPPHVADDWDVKQAWTHIIGEGHGARSQAPPTTGDAPSRQEPAPLQSPPH